MRSPWARSSPSSSGSGGTCPRARSRSGDAHRVHVVLQRLATASAGSWKSGPTSTSKPRSAKAVAITFMPRSCPSWPSFTTRMRGRRPSRSGARPRRPEDHAHSSSPSHTPRLTSSTNVHVRPVRRKTASRALEMLLQRTSACARGRRGTSGRQLFERFPKRGRRQAGMMGLDGGGARAHRRARLEGHRPWERARPRCRCRGAARSSILVRRRRDLLTPSRVLSSRRSPFSCRASRASTSTLSSLQMWRSGYQAPPAPPLRHDPAASAGHDAHVSDSGEVGAAPGSITSTEAVRRLRRRTRSGRAMPRALLVGRPRGAS